MTPRAIGIDFGGTSVKMGVCQGDKILEAGEPIPTSDYDGPDALIAAMAENVRSFADRHEGIRAVGVGAPGLVDFSSGLVHKITNVAGWVDVRLAEALKEQTALPTTVDNDANCMTYAEWRLGAGQGMANIVALTLGTGIGGGLVLENQLYRGSKFAAGEIGQMSIAFDGVEGPFGNVGAIEKYMGNRQIAEFAAEQYAAAGTQRDPDQLTPKLLAEAAAQGDPVAQRIWSQMGHWLGTVLASIVWLLNPDALIIGGGVARAERLLFDPLSESLNGMLSPVVSRDLQLLPARFGNDAGIIGSAAQALDTAR